MIQPKIPARVLEAIQAYGDARADNGGRVCAQTLACAITEIREWAAKLTTSAPQEAPAPLLGAEPVTLADVIDALNVFNRPKPNEDDGPWEAGHYIRVDYLPAFINIIAAAWFAPQAAALPLTAAATDVLAERQRQISVEGWTARHDDKHSDGSMALAAACYACNAATWAESGRRFKPENYRRLASPGFSWPWALKWWKPKSQRQDLVRAAALILAEIERLDRKAGITTTTKEKP